MSVKYTGSCQGCHQIARLIGEGASSGLCALCYSGAMSQHWNLGHVPEDPTEADFVELLDWLGPYLQLREQVPARFNSWLVFNDECTRLKLSTNI
jgi:hypothetical protein